MTARVWLACTVLFACALRAAAAAPATGAHDELAGVWRIHTPVTRLLTSEGRAPPLRPAAQAVYQQRQKLQASGDSSYDTTIRCKPMGLPRTAYDPEGGPFEIIVNPTVIVFGYTWNRMVRFAYVQDGTPEVLGPTYYGTANARWQGNTLILETRGLHDTTLLDAAGMPHSDALRLTERYRLINNGTQLEQQLDLTDATTFTRPWQARLVYDRLIGARIAEDHCEERLKISDY